MPEVIKKESRKQQFSSLVPLDPDKSDDVFGCLTCKELKLIGMHAAMREIRKKETIYFQGDADNSLYMLDSGVVKLTKITPKGKQLIADNIKVIWDNEEKNPEKNLLNSIALSVDNRHLFI